MWKNVIIFDYEFWGPPSLHWNSNRKTKMDKRKSRMEIKNRSQKQKISSRNAFHIKIKLLRFLSIICMLSNACTFCIITKRFPKVVISLFINIHSFVKDIIVLERCWLYLCLSKLLVSHVLFKRNAFYNINYMLISSCLSKSKYEHGKFAEK